MVMMVALQVFATQGGEFGWTSILTIALLVTGIVFAFIFYRIETRSPHAFVDFGLFWIMTYTGATISNFLLNASAGILNVDMILVQFDGVMMTNESGILTCDLLTTYLTIYLAANKLLLTY